jgi:uncharacterized protein YjbI with pentapeptide repeats
LRLLAYASHTTRGTTPAEDASAEARTRYENRRQEQQVRLSAQNIMSRNLPIIDQHRRRWWHRTPASAAIPAWPEIRLDFTEALLIETSLNNCQLDYACFTHTQFIGRADFESAPLIVRRAIRAGSEI